jgi:hypothetical protein
MSWIQKRNIARVFNAFKRNKDKIYEEEIEALKLLNELVDKTSETYTKDNLLYAKLLCVFIRQNIHYYKDVKFAIKELKFQLHIPLETQLQMLTYDLNMINLQNAVDAKDALDKINNAWTKEQVVKSFYNSANDLLKEIENYS